MTQVDRLAPEDRRTLRCAAVVGASFETELLEAATGIGFDAELGLRLADFVVDEGGGRIRFRHALVRDAAYEGLPYRRRRELHARVGEAIEARSGEPEAESELLSLHFFTAGHMEKAWRYSRVAGLRAMSIFANVEASSFLDRASRRPGAFEAALDATKSPKLSATCGSGSGSSGGRRRLPSRATTGRGDLSGRAELQGASIAWRMGRYSLALRWLSAGVRELEGVAGPDASRRAGAALCRLVPSCAGSRAVRTTRSPGAGGRLLRPSSRGT